MKSWLVHVVVLGGNGAENLLFRNSQNTDQPSASLKYPKGRKPLELIINSTFLWLLDLKIVRRDRKGENPSPLPGKPPVRTTQRSPGLHMGASIPLQMSLGAEINS